MTVIDWEHVYEMERDVWGRTFKHGGAPDPPRMPHPLPPSLPPGQTARWVQFDAQLSNLDDALKLTQELEKRHPGSHVREVGELQRERDRTIDEMDSLD